ncbi:MAG: phasin family protein [Pseudomonadales bacterium]|uniref:Poly(Hydroxyalkanoate) granule-associated protein n=1 Tax=Oleiphilus messinensis TaxID=141451 RepID=A0A1Y0I6U5_9GAMM|nr:phasin family protein [Oleiphilus messinensis]ARU56218.1 poly(hydroxyalkanoate) granule-associated protein [Oleiphilus messinensis]MCG8611494.1 phasin family protein [Pseudomonadales bacterium]
MSEKQNEENHEHSNQLAEKIKDSARQIWLAGLGAYTKAEEDAGKIFDKLVKEGEEIENKTRGAVGKRIRAVEDTVGEVKDKATGTWDKLEGLFDQRVSAALKRLGIPNHTEIEDLLQQIDDLKQRVNTLEKEKSDR